MATTRKYEVRAKVGEFQGRDGETKGRWVTCGAILENDSGKMSLKMDCFPVSGDGWFALFEPEDRSSSPSGTQQNSSSDAKKQDSSQDKQEKSQNTNNEDLPF
jgi:hypothetical protein